ncbi:hypothetical protein KIN20_006959 [Parelaphostrongylus tenuis]|uniref:Uncharacterized protein n=1 Tax=Parelaphostrongylus tenuis TaxID=148309 RepID=A0AAD5M5Q7_PARTN|nr:hypothetical protein KIN20_006959 [Parelaphostrongylus tenuis]
MRLRQRQRDRARLQRSKLIVVPGVDHLSGWQRVRVNRPGLKDDEHSLQFRVDVRSAAAPQADDVSAKLSKESKRRLPGQLPQLMFSKAVCASLSNSYS